MCIENDRPLDSLRSRFVTGIESYMHLGRKPKIMRYLRCHQLKRCLDKIVIKSIKCGQYLLYRCMLSTIVNMMYPSQLLGISKIATAELNSFSMSPKYGTETGSIVPIIPAASNGFSKKRKGQ